MQYNYAFNHYVYYKKLVPMHLLLVKVERQYRQ